MIDPREMNEAESHEAEVFVLGIIRRFFEAVGDRMLAHWPQDGQHRMVLLELTAWMATEAEMMSNQIEAGDGVVKGHLRGQ